MVGGHSEMSGAFLDHLEHGIQHADHRAEGAIFSLVEAARSVEMTEQLVGAIDQVDDHAGPTSALTPSAREDLHRDDERISRCGAPDCEVAISTAPRSCHEDSLPVKTGSS